MIDGELKKRIADYFDAGELVDFLQIKADWVVELFEEEIEEAIDDIVEFMDYGTRRVE